MASRIYEQYCARFPETMPDSRALSPAILARLDQIMQTALNRGTPITDADIGGPQDKPDPSKGKVL